jgi:hypothetical protein
MNNAYKKRLEKIFNRIDKMASKGKDSYLEYTRYIDELLEKGDIQPLQQCLYIFYKIDIQNENSIDNIKRKTWDDICFLTNTPFSKKMNKLLNDKKVYQNSFDFFSTDLSYTSINTSDPLSSTYSVTALTQSFSLTRNNELIYLNVLNPDLNIANINRATWEIIDGVDIPTSITPLQSITIGTSSHIKTEIPVAVIRQYLITTEQRDSNTGICNFLNYKITMSNANYLGKIVEVDVYSPDANYYIQNKQFARITGTRKTYLEAYKVNPLLPGGFEPASIFAYDNAAYDEQTNLLTRYQNAIDYLNS